MKIEPQQVDITSQLDFSIDGCKKHIENCTRVCYQSYDTKKRRNLKKYLNDRIKSYIQRGLLGGYETNTR